MARTNRKDGPAGIAGARDGGDAATGVPGNPEIVIDASSGISEDEQREILVQINGIAEKNRKSLSSGTETGAGSKKRFKARKNGGFLPVMVNVAAIAALAGGFLVLHMFQSTADVQAREGTWVFDSGQRVLIEEIRRETARRIEEIRLKTGELLEAKDMEISAILSSLDALEAQLRALLAGSEVLTMEQLAVQEDLRAQQEELRLTLARTREERSRILDYARSRESALQAQLEARERELVAVTARHADELSAARAELAQLYSERTQAAAVEAQIAGLFATVNTLVTENRFGEAEEAIGSLWDVLNLPAFIGLRAIQERRELYVQATGSLETLLEEARAAHAAMVAGELPADRDAENRLMQEIGRLEEEIALRDDKIVGLVAGDEGAAQVIAQLQTRNTQLEGSVADMDTRINNLNTEVGNLITQQAGLQGTLNTERQTVTNLRQDVSRLQTENSTLNQQVAARDGTISTLQGERDTVRTQSVSALESIAAEVQGLQVVPVTQLGPALAELQRVVTSLQEQIQARD